MSMREDLIHVAVRRVLRNNGWSLVAGQYPNGSDDELPPLNIVDPLVACDDSPDPRRHSLDKLVPDIVAGNGRLLIIAEHKPRYFPDDAIKLSDLIETKRTRLITALES